jgi:sugar phosphate isomerase/epimerase
MRIGISSWAYGWAVGVPGYPQPAQPLTGLNLLQSAHNLGLDLVQIADNLPIHLFSLTELSTIRQVAGDFGIAIELGTRGLEPSHLLNYLDLAQYFDSKLIRTLPLEATSPVVAPEAEQSIAEVIEKFRAAGVVLALENYERQTSLNLAELVRKIGDEYLGVCLDTANSLGALETPKDVLRNLRPYIRNVHLKDFVVRRPAHMMGFHVEGCPAGQGLLNVHWLLAELREHCPASSIILEQWTPWTGSVDKTIAIEKEWAEQSIVFLNQYR